MSGETKTFSPNDEQKRVIGHSGGPLLVVAGAGTGKTFVIIEKIKKLLAGGVRPESILALTFTEKAASEMLTRLLNEQPKLLPEIPLMTFNGYGESILREFGSHIGIGRNFRLMSEQAQIVFFRQNIDAFKLDYFLPLTSLPDSIISDILGVFSAAKQNLVSADDYLKFAQNLPDLNEAEILEKKQHTELAFAYQTYQKLCQEQNLIDYDDQIYMVIKLLEMRPNVKNKLAKRYHTIFVDEFQDTNPMQSELIDLLSKKQPNLIVVGDDDQSIYGFRGATLSNILSFKKRYPGAKEVALTENFRSSQPILDAAYRLIQNNNPNRLEATLAISKKLIAHEPKGPEPRLFFSENYENELSWLAEDIKNRLEQGVAPKDIAVLARRRLNLLQLHHALDQAGVEHNLIGQSEDLYSQPVVRQMIELARCLGEPDNNNALHHSLTSPVFNINNSIVAPLATQARYQHERLEDVIQQNCHDQTALKALRVINETRQQAGNLPVGRLLYQILDKTGYLKSSFEMAQTNSEVASSLQYLSQYFTTLKNFESIANQPTVMEYLKDLPALQAAGEYIDDTMEINDQAINLLTIHKAKGLEWSVVYVPDCTEMSFPIKKTARGLSLPADLTRQTTSQADEHYAEERRLMYVAITRAKQELILSYSGLRGQSKTARRPSRFLPEIFGENFQAELVSSLDNQLAAGPISDTSLKENKISVPKDILDGEKVYLSASQAVCIIDCPYNFYYKFVLRAPEAPIPAANYGTIMHALIEQINRSLLPDGSPVSIAELRNQLKANWIKTGYVSKGQQQRALETANQTLIKLYKQIISGPKPYVVEQPFSALLKEQQITLRGRYDVVYSNPEGIEIRDYKTGSSVNKPEKAKARAQASLQLTIYALAWQINSGELPGKLSLEFIDTGVLGSVKKTARGIDGLVGKLTIAANQIRQSDFPLGQNHEYCIHP